MPDLLLELFSEEIPARMQAQAAADLKTLVTDALVERGLTYEGAQSFATPRRLALHVAGLPARQPDTREERKGPRVGAPEGAIQGFLKSAGLASIDQATITERPKKGEFYTAVIARPGRDTIEVLAERPARHRQELSLAEVDALGQGLGRARRRCAGCGRCSRSSAPSGPRPRSRRSCRSRSATSWSGNITRGHRFMAPEPFTVRRFDDYAPALEKHKVVLDAERRAEHHPPRRPRPRLRAGARGGRGRGAAGRGRRASSNGPWC